MRRGSRQIAEKRSPGVGFAFHPRHRFSKENIRRVTVVGLAVAVMDVGVVEIVILPMIRNGTDMRRRKPEAFVKSAILRAVGIGITQMPFAEQTRAPARVREHVAHGRKLAAKQSATAADIRSSITQSIHARHELTARWRAHRSDVEIGQPDAFGTEPVEIRCLQNWIAVRRKLAIPLIVRDDDQDVRSLRCWLIGGAQHGHRSQQQDSEEGEGTFHRVGS